MNIIVRYHFFQAEAHSLDAGYIQLGWVDTGEREREREREREASGC